MDTQIGFIGGGQMAQALAKGMLNASIVTGSKICVADPAAPALEAFRSAVPGCREFDSNPALVQECSRVVVAVKPQYFEGVTVQLRGARTSQKLFVSIMAGVGLPQLYKAFRTERVIRVMPNTPALIGLGAAGFARGDGATEADEQWVQAVLQSVGIALPLPEAALDAVTGLSGSGPAFVFQFIEALSDGGVGAGLPRDVAQRLAVQTVRGAAELMIQSGEHPAVLKDRVASPGGTTIEGLGALESGGLRAAVINAVLAATRRSGELGRPNI